MSQKALVPCLDEPGHKKDGKGTKRKTQGANFPQLPHQREKRATSMWGCSRGRRGDSGQREVAHP